MPLYELPLVLDPQPEGGQEEQGPGQVEGTPPPAPGPRRHLKTLPRRQRRLHPAGRLPRIRMRLGVGGIDFSVHCSEVHP